MDIMYSEIKILNDSIVVFEVETEEFLSNVVINKYGQSSISTKAKMLSHSKKIIQALKNEVEEEIIKHCEERSKIIFF